MDKLTTACREAGSTIHDAVVMLEIKGSVSRSRLQTLQSALAKADTSITFPIPNGINPDLHSCTLKIWEEVGELMQVLGRDRGTEWWVHRAIEEAFDGAQALVTLANMLANENNIDLSEKMVEHEAKLIRKGYLLKGDD